MKKFARRIRRAYFASGTYDSKTGKVTINDTKNIKKSKPELLMCGHPAGCSNIATHYYQLAFMTVVRCDDHDEHTLYSTIYDSGELHRVADTKKAKKIGLVPINLTVPAVIGPVTLKFCEVCHIAIDDHTINEQKECAKKKGETNE